MNVAVVIPTLNEEESIAAVVSSIPRDCVDRVIVADGGSRDATTSRARSPGAEMIDAGRGYGAPASQGRSPPKMPTSSSSSTATAPTIRAPSRRWSAHSFRAARFRHRLARARPARAWQHRLAPARSRPPGRWGMCAAALRRALHRHVRVPCDLRDGVAGARYARADLRLEYRDADAGRAAGLRVLEVPVDYRRRSGGDLKVAGSLSGRSRRRAHRRDVHSSCRRARRSQRMRDPQREPSGAR